MRKSKANSNTRTGGGFTAIELLITATVLTIVTGVGIMGITRARASVRLAGAAREYAAYIEKARMSSIRSHADDTAEQATITISDNKLSYTVTMDLDGDGDLDTRTIALPDGVEFDRVETIAFDWRGRTLNTANGVTESNAQVSILLKGDNDSTTIDITGSGDITIDSDVFDDDLPQINLHVDDLAQGATPTPTPYTETATPTPTPTGVDPIDDSANPQPTPTPDLGGDTIPADPTPTPTATPTPTPTATPTPTPQGKPTPTPAPTVCALSLDLPKLVLTKQGSGDIKVSHDAGVSLTISGSSSTGSELQVFPNSVTVTSGGSGLFTIKAKKTIGIYSVTFSSSCGTKTVPVVVIDTGLGIL